jgi:hypothetical protein
MTPDSRCTVRQNWLRQAKEADDRFRQLVPDSPEFNHSVAMSADLRFLIEGHAERPQERPLCAASG